MRPFFLSFNHKTTHHGVAAVGCFMVCALLLSSCDRAGSEARKRISPEYDQATGKLKLLKYDSNGDGTVDTWSYMDGARVVRIEIDKDQDGKIDRWEYYDANQKLDDMQEQARKAGLSSSAVE